jgi:hypothetical protein
MRPIGPRHPTGPLSRDRAHVTGVGVGIPRFSFAFACKLLSRKRKTHVIGLLLCASDKASYDYLR